MILEAYTNKEFKMFGTAFRIVGYGVLTVVAAKTVAAVVPHVAETLVKINEAFTDAGVKMRSYTGKAA